MMDELTIALLMSEFGQVWASLGKSGQDTPLCSALHKIGSNFGQDALQNRIRLQAACLTKSHTTLGKVLYKITYNFGQHALQNRI